LATADEVPREEWRTYVKTLQMEQQYPGIQGFGFVYSPFQMDDLTKTK